ELGEEVVERRLLDEGETVDDPATAVVAPVTRRLAGSAQAAPGESPVDVVVGVLRQAPLFEVILAGHAGGGLADLLHRPEQQTDQDRTNRDHDEQLDSRESGRGTANRSVGVE